MLKFTVAKKKNTNHSNRMPFFTLRQKFKVITCAFEDSG